MSTIPSDPAPSAADEPAPPGTEVPAPSAKSQAPATQQFGEPPPAKRRRRNPLIYFWFYSLARVALYLVLWGLLWLFGLGGLVGAAVALVLSVPLSFVLLARPRSAMTASMMERLNVRQERTAALDQELSGGERPSGDDETQH